MKSYIKLFIPLLILCLFLLVGCAVNAPEFFAFETAQVKVLSLSESSVSEVSGSYTVDAIISPAYASNKAVSWSANWYNAGSAWASGKNVDDYVSLDIDGLSCTVTCLQAFGEQIKLVCNAQSNPNASSFVTFDYSERFDISTSVFVYDVTSCNENSVATVAPLNMQLYEKSSSFNINSFDYTIASNATYSYKLRLNDYLYTALNNANLARANNEYLSISDIRPCTIANKLTKKTMVFTSEPTMEELNSPGLTYSNRINAFNDVVEKYDLNYDIEILVETVTSVETVYSTFYFKFDRTVLHSNANYHTVTFSTGTGSPVPGYGVLDGEVALVPEDPTMENRAFTGWLLNSEEYDFSSPVTADITLTANFVRPRQFTMIVDPGVDEVYLSINRGEETTYNVSGGSRITIANVWQVSFRIKGASNTDYVMVYATDFGYEGTITTSTSDVFSGNLKKNTTISIAGHIVS